MPEDHSFFEQEITLENDRAKLSPLSMSHLQMLDTIAYEEQLWKVGMSIIQTQEQLRSYMTKALQERENKLSYPFLIYDKQLDAVAGSTRYGNISLPDKRLEIGWTWIHPRHQRTGLNKACKFLLLQHAFEVLQMNRVELKTDVLNVQSRAAIKKIGATEEGILRKHQITYSGRVRDSIIFSIISEEWPSIKQNLFSDFLQ